MPPSSWADSTIGREAAGEGGGTVAEPIVNPRFLAVVVAVLAGLAAVAYGALALWAIRQACLEIRENLAVGWRYLCEPNFYVSDATPR